MRDIQPQLDRARASAESAAFEADFAKSITSLGALQITLSTARDHLLSGIQAIDEAVRLLDRDIQSETIGDDDNDK